MSTGALRASTGRRVIAALGVLFACALVGCGSDPAAPTISNLRVSPLMARPSDVLSIVIDFVDPDGDLAGGSAELSLWRRTEPEGLLFEVSLAGDSTAEKGAIAMTLRVPAAELPGEHALSVTVIDATERRSAPLVTDLEILAP